MKDTHLYILTCAVILAVSTVCLWYGKLPATNFESLIKWSFASLCTGGGLAAFRNIRLGPPK